MQLKLGMPLRSRKIFKISSDIIMNNKKYENVDQYINTFPKDVKDILTKIRNIIIKTAPNAIECIKYDMPSYVLNGNLIHFAGYTKHIGIYPIPSGVEKFKKELKVYKTGKGSIQFQLSEPIPYDLIKKIVEFRVSENLNKI